MDKKIENIGLIIQHKMMIGHIDLNKSKQVISYNIKGDLGMEKSYMKQRYCDSCAILMIKRSIHLWSTFNVIMTI